MSFDLCVSTSNNGAAGYSTGAESTCYGKDRAPYFVEMNVDSFTVVLWDWIERLWLSFALLPVRIDIAEAINCRNCC